MRTEKSREYKELETAKRRHKRKHKRKEKNLMQTRL